MIYKLCFFFSMWTHTNVYLDALRNIQTIPVNLISTTCTLTQSFIRSWNWISLLQTLKKCRRLAEGQWRVPYSGSHKGHRERKRSRLTPGPQSSLSAGARCTHTWVVIWGRGCTVKESIGLKSCQLRKEARWTLPPTSCQGVKRTSKEQLLLSECLTDCQPNTDVYSTFRTRKLRLREAK